MQSYAGCIATGGKQKFENKMNAQGKKGGAEEKVKKNKMRQGENRKGVGWYIKSELMLKKEKEIKKQNKTAMEE
jgi:hypothetical protein